MSVINLAAAIDYQSGSVVSKKLQKNENGNITLFAFDKGEALSEHTAPFDAFVLIIDGAALITLDGKEHTLKSGEAILMPANMPHALKAQERFKMCLTMIKA